MSAARKAKKLNACVWLHLTRDITRAEVKPGVQFAADTTELPLRHVDLLTLKERYEKMANSSISELIASFDALDCLGFAVGLHIKFTSPAYLLQTYPVAWNEHYSKNGLVMSDPTVAWGLSNSGSIKWSDLVENDSAGVLVAASEYGLRYGATVSVLDKGSRSIAGFAREDRDFSAVELQHLNELTVALHAATAEDVELSAEDKALLAERTTQV